MGNQAFEDVSEASDILGTAAQIAGPALEDGAKIYGSGGYGGGGYGGGSYLAHAPKSTALSEGIGIGGNFLGAASGALGLFGGLNEYLHADNALDSNLGAANALSGGISMAGGFAGLAGAESGFFGGLAGTAAATSGTGAAIGAGITGAGSVLGAGLAGIGIGRYADGAMERTGLLHNDFTGEDEGYTDWVSRHAREAADEDTALGSVKAGLMLGGGSLAGAVAAPFVAGIGSTVGMGSAIWNAMGHNAD